jgi:hypothetical protein
MWHAWERRLRGHRVVVGKPEGKRPLGRPRLKWENGIRMDLRETGRGCRVLIQIARDRGRWRYCCKYGDEPSCSGATELVNTSW